MSDSMSRMCSRSERGMCAACTDRAAVRIPCRARKTPARLVNVPPEPISWAPRQSRRGTLARMAPLDGFAELAHAARRDAVLEVFLRQPDRAERQRHETLDDALGAERELGRAAADVQHDRASDAHVEVGDRAAKAETRLFGAVEHAHAQAGHALDFGDERGGVGRVAHGARRDDVDARRAELLGERRHPLDGFDRRADREVGEAAVRGESRRESRRGLHLVDDLNRAVGGNVGDDLTNRIRSDVDRGDAPVAWRDRASLWAITAPDRDSHGQASASYAWVSCRRPRVVADATRTNICWTSRASSTRAVLGVTRA